MLNPRIAEATGRCPPEFVGGAWGHIETPEAVGDKRHDQHDEIRACLGEDFDPNDFDPEPLKADVAVRAKRWSRKPKRPRPA